MSGRSGLSSANGIFSPSVSGRPTDGCCKCVILLMTEKRGLEILVGAVVVDVSVPFPSSFDDSTDEFRSDLNLLSNNAVTVSVKEFDPV